MGEKLGDFFLWLLWLLSACLLGNNILLLTPISSDSRVSSHHCCGHVAASYSMSGAGEEKCLYLRGRRKRKEEDREDEDRGRRERQVGGTGGF
eukprot:750869-Hanusia_phi.AAC.3